MGMRRSIKGFTEIITGLGSLLALVLATGVTAPLIAHADDWQSLPLGTVVHQQPMTLPTDLQPIATGTAIEYVSSDVNNNRVLVTGAIITPNNQHGHATIVAWAHGTTGFSSQCAPSQNLNVFWPEAVAAVKSYLQQGWTVVATDYQGLGGTGAHQYLIGNTEARSVIDSVRAARNLLPNLSSSWIVSGHSQGGQAALFAGEIAPTYGSGLHLLGVVAMAPASNLEEIAPVIAGTPGQGYLPIALEGLAAVDPTVNVDSLLAQQGQANLSVLSTGCLEEILTAYQNLNPHQLLVGGQLPANIVSEIASYGDPAQQPPSTPILLVQGTDDTTIPPALTQQLQSEECAYHGASIDLQMVQGADHDTIPILSTDLVSAYINNLLTGGASQSNC